jgi:hypothetical protein
MILAMVHPTDPQPDPAAMSRLDAAPVRALLAAKVLLGGLLLGGALGAGWAARRLSDPA